MHMLIFIKKQNAVLLLVVMAVLVFTAGLAVRTKAVPTGVTLSGRRIVVDAGHGEPDGGAVGPAGVAEQAINLTIARFLQEQLEKAGMEVVMTRQAAEGIYDGGLSTVREKKRSDLYNREKVMNHSDADLFVSIHLNKFSESRYSGPQVFYSPNQPDSEQAATYIQESLISVLSPPSRREIKKSTDDIFLLKQAKIPAVLVECGFLSNPQEEALLLDKTYQKKVALAIYQGIVSYLTKA